MPEIPKTGVWFVGARGSVATTAMVGAAAVGAGISPPVGMVTASEPFASAPLPPLGSIVFGGHDVVATPLVKRAEALAEAGVFPSHLVAAVADRLAAADHDILLMAPHPDVSPPQLRQQLQDALGAFRERHQLDDVLVVNVASTEQSPTWDRPPTTTDELEQMIELGWEQCPPSLVFAAASLDAGCGFVDFTPAVGSIVPALVQRAHAAGLPLAGRDGKTGETLLKTVLAPMFADRALRVLSWNGTNILGGGDGARLADPRFAASKISTKAQSLESILPEPVHSQVHIDMVPDMGEWKTAWNHIHFEGFLGTRMNLQFTWQGCDSTLAAPLILDLARLGVAAAHAGIGGNIPEFGFFFKDPAGSGQHRLGEQYQDLCRWASEL